MDPEPLTTVGTTTLATAGTTSTPTSGTTTLATDGSSEGPVLEGRVVEGLLILYDFDEAAGTTIFDHAPVGPPLNVTFPVASPVAWEFGGLHLQGTISLETSVATKVVEACVASGEVSVEVWVVPDRTQQQGPAKIVGLPSTGTHRNFTLGQGGTKTANADLGFAVRTSSTETTALPYLYATDAVGAELIHIVATHASSGAEVIYIDGVEAASGTKVGDFSDWNAAIPVTLNSAVNPWQGVLHLVGIYDSALSPRQVLQNYAAGPQRN